MQASAATGEAFMRLYDIVLDEALRRQPGERQAQAGRGPRG